MDIIKLPALSMRQDKLVKKYNFDKLFRTCIPKRETWEEAEGKALLQGELWFTDGSKGEGWAGAGLYDSAGKRGLPKPEISSILVWKCKKALNQLAGLNNVALIWVPGHSEIKGNKKADQLAMKGAAGLESILGPAPCCT